MFSKPRLQNSSPILAFWCCNQAKWKTEETHFGWLLCCQIRLFLLLSYTNTKLRGRSGEQGEKYGCVWEERKDGFRILNESNKLKTCLTISETKVSRKRRSVTLYIQFFKRLFLGVEPSFQKESYEESQIYKTDRKNIFSKHCISSDLSYLFKFNVKTNLLWWTPKIKIRGLMTIILRELQQPIDFCDFLLLAYYQDFSWLQW